MNKLSLSFITVTENAHHGEQSVRKRFKRSGFRLGDFGWDLRKQDFFPGLDIVRKYRQVYDGIFLMNVTYKARRLEWC